MHEFQSLLFRGQPWPILTIEDADRCSCRAAELGRSAPGYLAGRGDRDGRAAGDGKAIEAEVGRAIKPRRAARSRSARRTGYSRWTRTPDGAGDQQWEPSPSCLPTRADDVRGARTTLAAGDHRHRGTTHAEAMRLSLPRKSLIAWETAWCDMPRPSRDQMAANGSWRSTHGKIVEGRAVALDASGRCRPSGELCESGRPCADTAAASAIWMRLTASAPSADRRACGRPRRTAMMSARRQVHPLHGLSQRPVDRSRQASPPGRAEPRRPPRR